MEWNWQRADWPDFSWQRSRLLRAEEQFLVGGGVFLGSVSHLDPADRDQLTVDALCRVAENCRKSARSRICCHLTSESLAK